MSAAFGSDSSYSDLGAEQASQSTSSQSSAPFTFSDQDSDQSKEKSTRNASTDTEEIKLHDEEKDIVNLPPVNVDSDLLSDDLSSGSLLTPYYKPPSLRDVIIKGAINCFLPFINGMMLGFGEIFAHELGFRWGWSAARVRSYFVSRSATDNQGIYLTVNRFRRLGELLGQVCMLFQSKISLINGDCYNDE